MTKGVVKKVRPEVAAELAVEEFRTLVEIVQQDGRVGTFDLRLVHDPQGRLILLYREPWQAVGQKQT